MSKANAKLICWWQTQGSILLHSYRVMCSGVGSSCALRGPQIQVVGVALIIEFYDHNIPFLKVIHW